MLLQREFDSEIPLQLDSVMPADGMFAEATVRDMMNTTGGALCYVYE